VVRWALISVEEAATPTQVFELRYQVTKYTYALGNEGHVGRS